MRRLVTIRRDRGVVNWNAARSFGAKFSWCFWCQCQFSDANRDIEDLLSGRVCWTAIMPDSSHFRSVMAPCNTKAPAVMMPRFLRQVKKVHFKNLGLVSGEEQMDSRFREN